MINRASECHLSYCLSPPRESCIMATTITLIALAGISTLTFCLLGHFQLISGINTLSQTVLACSSGGLAVVALVMSAVSALKEKEPILPEIHDPATLKATLDQLCTGMIEALEAEDPMDTIHQLAEEIPLELLEKAVQTAFNHKSSAQKLAQSMIGQAQFFVAARHPPTPSCQARMRDLGDKILGLFDNLFWAFGISEFFKPSENDQHADAKFQKIVMLISFFTLMTSTILPLLGITTGSSVVAGILIFFCVMSLIWPKIRPFSTHLPEAENWSKQVRMGEMIAPLGRKEAVDRIRDALNQRQPVMIVGPSGIGKTIAVQALTAAIEQGKSPELAGKEVIYFNMADLISHYDYSGYRNTILKRISAAGIHNYIPVIDNLLKAYKPHEGTDVGSQLRTFLDDKPENSFKFFIGIAELEEYAEWAATSEASEGRRFDNVVYVRDTSIENTLAILRRHILQEAPYALVEKGALEFLYESTKDKGPLPLFPLQILKRCITKISQTQKTPLAQKRDHEESKLLEAHSEGAVSGDEVVSTKIDTCENHLKVVQEKFDPQKKDADLVAAARNALIKVREAKFQAVLDTVSSEENQNKLTEFLLLKYFFERHLEEAIRTTSQKIPGFRATINRELVQEALKEYEESHREQIQAVQEGQKHKKDRLKT